MMKLPTIKFVFNRRKNATKKHPASVELRIGQGLKCKYLATGIRLLPKEWGHDRVTNRPDSMELVAVVVIEYFHRACDGIEWCQLTCEALVESIAGRDTDLGFVGLPASSPGIVKIISLPSSIASCNQNVFRCLMKKTKKLRKDLPYSASTSAIYGINILVAQNKFRGINSKRSRIA